MLIGIFQDLHANLPALQKALEIFQQQQCSEIYHVGDLIGIGPYPREVMKLATSTPNMKFIMGNHDYWYAYGLPDPIPTYMNAEEVAHHLWTHAQLEEEYKTLVQEWPFTIELEVGDTQTLTFQHYGIDQEKNWFKPILKKPDPDDLDLLFEGRHADFVFYGHHHAAHDAISNCRYVNLGSAGCYDRAEVRLGLLEVSGSQLALKKYSIPYDDNGLMEAFEKREVPARAFIKSTFITRSDID